MFTQPSTSPSEPYLSFSNEFFCPHSIQLNLSQSSISTPPPHISQTQQFEIQWLEKVTTRGKDKRTVTSCVVFPFGVLILYTCFKGTGSSKQLQLQNYMLWCSRREVFFLSLTRRQEIEMPLRNSLIRNFSFGSFDAEFAGEIRIFNRGVGFLFFLTSSMEKLEKAPRRQIWVKNFGYFEKIHRYIDEISYEYQFVEKYLKRHLSSNRRIKMTFYYFIFITKISISQFIHCLQPIRIRRIGVFVQ